MKSEEENDHPDLSTLISKMNAHIDTRISYLRLIISEKLAIVISKMASTIIVLVIFLLFFLFLNVGVALWIGKRMNDYAMGFGIVSGFYLLCGLIYLMLRRSVFEKKMQDNIIKAMFAEEEEDEDED